MVGGLTKAVRDLVSACVAEWIEIQMGLDAAQIRKGLDVYKRQTVGFTRFTPLNTRKENLRTQRLIFFS